MNQRRIFQSFILLAGLILSSPLFALSLDQAKAAGIIGERYDGYLGVVASPAPAEVAEMVKSINNQRRTEYKRLANKNNVGLNVIERLSGRQLISQLPSGQFYLTDSGQWLKK